MNGNAIAVVGAGFSGTLLSLHLLRRCRDTTRIALIERHSQFGRGQAYSTGNPNHLLNVPAAKMSAFHGQPLHFLDWLRGQPEEVLAGCVPAEGAFVPRWLYGAYLRALLNEELKRAGERCELIRGEVLDLDCSGPRLGLRLSRGRTLEADIAVLAIGNFPPEPPAVADPSFYDGPLYRPDPWAADAVSELDPDAPVLLIGTGLTMIDTVISLLDGGHRGPIHALSRRGLLPHRHAPGSAAGSPPHAYPAGLRPLLRDLRRAAAEAAAAGADWRPVVDALRPFTCDLWQSLGIEDRRRFLRHLRPWWEIHRHRLPGVTADRIGGAVAAGRLQVLAGRIERYQPVGPEVEVTYRPRYSDRKASIRVGRVINCAGPLCDYARIGHPLVRTLLDTGAARPDGLRLGLDVTGTCALVGRDGAISRRLFAVGPVTKGAFWEMTAVPDIRRQCEMLSTQLTALA